MHVAPQHGSQIVVLCELRAQLVAVLQTFAIKPFATAVQSLVMETYQRVPVGTGLQGTLQKIQLGRGDPPADFTLDSGIQQHYLPVTDQHMLAGMNPLSCEVLAQGIAIIVITR